MRKWMWMAVGVGLAAAQEPPKPPSEPPKVEEQEKKPVVKLPAPLQQKKYESFDRALRRSWQSKALTAPGPCAIPLLNVWKPAPGGQQVKPDPMIIPVPKGPSFSKEEVKVPAPSCDDVK